MTHEAFVALVREMRQCQKDYFKTRDFNILNASKRLEKQVDEAIKDFETPLTPTLFN